MWSLLREENELVIGFFFSSRRRHTRCGRDWSSDVCSSDLLGEQQEAVVDLAVRTQAKPLHVGVVGAVAALIGAAKLPDDAVVQAGHVEPAAVDARGPARVVLVKQCGSGPRPPCGPSDRDVRHERSSFARASWAGRCFACRPWPGQCRGPGVTLGWKTPAGSPYRGRLCARRVATPAEAVPAGAQG